MKRWQRLLWKWSAGLFAGLVILLATLAALFRLAAPLVPGYRVQVENWASRAIQHPVLIRSMGAEWGWFGPEVVLEDVKLLSKDRQRVVIAAKGVRLSISPWSLLQGEPHLNRIILSEPRVEVARDAEGVFSVRGLEGATQQVPTDWQQTLQEISAQPAVVVIRDGQLGLFDMQQSAPELFQNIDLKINNDASHHRVAGDLQLPASFGRSLKFDLGADGPGAQPAEWQWHARVSGTTLELPRWFAYWPAYVGRFLHAVADLDAEASGNGAVPDAIAVRLTAHDVLPAAAAFPTSKAGGFNLLQGDVRWSRVGSGWTLEGTRLQFQHDVRAWPKATFDLDYQQADGADHWSGDATFLRLEDLTTLMGWLPPQLSPDSSKLLQLAPHGDIADLGFKLQQHTGTVDNWSVRGHFTDLGVRAYQTWPGFYGMTGMLDLNQDGGSATLAARDAAADFPGVFRGPLLATYLNADIHVSHDGQGWRVASDDLAAGNADVSTRAHGGIQFPADGSAPVLDLDAVVDHAHGRNKSTYFPVGIMSKDLVHWLDTAIVDGEVQGGSVSLHGKTSDFPFRDGHGGVFDIKFHLVHGELDYSPGWPVLKEVDADVRFLDQGLDIHAHAGRILGDELIESTASFADLDKGILVIDGGVRGGAASSLEFLRSGPLKDRFGSYLDGFTATGRSDVNLHLVIPVDDLDKFTLQGTDRLRDVSLGPNAMPGLALQKLNGELGFTGEGFSTDDLSGVMLGAPVSISIHPAAKRSNVIVFTAHGGATGEAISSALKLPAANAVTGQTTWRLDGRVPNNPAASAAGFSLNLRSDLKGLGVDLPPPFGKDADGALPFNFALKLVSDGSMTLTGAYAGNAQMKLSFSRDSGVWQFDRGGLHIGTGTANLPEDTGLAVTGTLTVFPWASWKAYLPSPATAAPIPVSTQPSPGPLLPEFLQSIDLGVSNFTGFGQSINNLHVGLTRGDDGWQLRVDSAAVAGTIAVPETIDAGHPLNLSMDRVLLTKAPVNATGTTPVAATPLQFDPRRVPAMRFQSRHFQYADMNLDNVTLTLVPQPDGIGLHNLTVSAAAFSLTGSGSWVMTPTGAQQSALSVDIESQDVKKSLQALGYAAGITGDKGQIIAALNWQDSPFGDIVGNLDGTIRVKLEDGQLEEVQPGAGRLFGLLSLNALPRRLLLNFSDVFSKGFHYDSIEGDFTLEKGNAVTKDLQLKAPAAQILIAGRIGLAQQDFDEAVIVSANVGSTLPVIGALAGGPVVGAVVLLLSQIFKKPLTAAGETRYHLSGSWTNPVLDKVPAPPLATARRPP